MYIDSEAYKGLVDIICRNKINRNVVVITKKKSSFYPLEQLLQERGIHKVIVGTTILDINIESDYVVIIGKKESFTEKIRGVEYKDYVFTEHKNIFVGEHTNYEDEYGNRVFNSGPFKISIESMSYNNTIVIDDSIPACANAKIVIKGSNCRIKIGKCRFGNSPYIETFTNSEMNIGDKSSFGHNLKACLTAGTMVLCQDLVQIKMRGSAS